MNITQSLVIVASAFSSSLVLPVLAEEGFRMTTATENRSTVSDLFVKADSRVLPISAKFEIERYVFSGTVSYLQQYALRGVPGYDFRWVRAEATDVGTPVADFIVKDVETSLTYKVPQTLPGGWQMDVTGGMKFLNGELLNTSSVLKTYSAQLAFTREFGKFTAESGLGYRVRNNPIGFSYRNSASAYIGGGYRFSPNRELEMYLDVRQGALRGSENEAEITAYFNQELPAKNLTLQSYVFKGVSQGNHDLETGLMLKIRF